jgi:hypothetical protein
VRILKDERTAIDKAWVVSKLVENYERAIGGKQAVDEDGNPIGPAAVHLLQLAPSDRKHPPTGKPHFRSRDHTEITPEVHPAADAGLRHQPGPARLRKNQTTSAR